LRLIGTHGFGSCRGVEGPSKGVTASAKLSDQFIMRQCSQLAAMHHITQWLVAVSARQHAQAGARKPLPTTHQLPDSRGQVVHAE